MLVQYDAPWRGVSTASEIQTLVQAARNSAPGLAQELNSLLDRALGLLARASTGADPHPTQALTDWCGAGGLMRPATALATADPRDRVGPEAGSALRFGRFVLYPGSRTLLRDGRPIALGGRAFDLLHVLVRSRGSVVGRAEIMRHVWPAMFVEDSNLRFQVACLRKALGPDRDLVKTVSGRGYLLTDDAAPSLPR